MNSDILRNQHQRWINKILINRNNAFTIIVEGFDDKNVYEPLLKNIDLKRGNIRIQVSFNQFNDSRNNTGPSGRKHALKVIEQLILECNKNSYSTNFFLAIVDKDFDGLINKKNLEKSYPGNVIYTDGRDLETMLFFYFPRNDLAELTKFANGITNSFFVGDKLKFILEVARQISAVMIESHKRQYQYPVSDYFKDPSRFEELLDFDEESFLLKKFLHNLELEKRKSNKTKKEPSKKDLINYVMEFLKSKRIAQKYIIHGKTLLRILDFAYQKSGLLEKNLKKEIVNNFSPDHFGRTSTHKKILSQLEQAPVLN